MLLLRWAGLFSLAISATTQRTIRKYDENEYFALQLSPNLAPWDVAQKLGMVFEGQVGELTGHYTFSCPKGQSAPIEDTLEELRRLRKIRRRSQSQESSSIVLDKRAVGLEGVLWSEKQRLRKRLVKRIPPEPEHSRQSSPDAQSDDEPDEDQQKAIERLNEIATQLDIKDPTFKGQWHLFNPLQLGHDLNVTGVWLDGITGNGSITAVIDDGLDMYSNDLKDNYFAEGSYDFNDDTDEPKPRLPDDRHGTRCAGEIAAVRNDVCGVGMAYDGKIAGIRILSKAISDEDEATSINYHFQENQIYSCSWGPPDDGKTMEGPGILIQRAMVNGIQNGRGGLGSVFVFAAGNGAASEDNCNFDGYTNSIYSITVGGIDRAGNHPYYSEACSAQLVVTYSSGHGDAIHTTDVGENMCYEGHGGTSAAGPLVAGTVALALSARPELTWRDLQYLCVQTAIPIHLEDGDWQDTKIGKKFSHTYGYGKVDAYAFVQAAKSFELVKPQAWFHSPWLSVQHAIPEGDQGLAASFDVTQEMLTKANLERLEHVTITMNIQHTRRGDLSVELRSPEGVISHIATTRRYDAEEAGYDDWTFMSVVHWGELGTGTWTVIVKDTDANEHNGTFIDWRLNLWGECIDPAAQDLYPMPDEHDDDHETATASVITTSITPTSQPTPLPTNPTDHIDRPTKPKPTETTTQTSSSISTTSSTQASTTTSVPAATHTYSDSFLPSFFPKFGVSKRTQIWIYGSFVLIVLFCICLGAYFYNQRKKRIRNTSHDTYEMVGDDEDDYVHPGPLSHSQKGSGKARRGGELYDAFAGESDEDLYSDEEYQDTPSGTTSNDTGSGSGSGEPGNKINSEHGVS